MWRVRANFGLLCALALASAGLAKEPPSAEANQWSKIERDLKNAAGFDDTWDRRPMWGYLSDYLHAQRQQTSERDLSKRIAARWAHVGDRGKFTPLLIDRKYSLAAMRQVGSVTWQDEFVDSFRACLLPLPGQVVLFAYPASGAANPRDVYYRHLTEVGRFRGYLEGQVYQRLRREIQQMGQDRWAFVFMRLYPEIPRDGGDVPMLRSEGDRYFVQFGDRSQEIQIPDEKVLGQRIGCPLDTWELPPPDNRRIYLAIDASQYLLHPARRGWLLAELKHGLESVPSTWLVHENVYLHTPSESVPWPSSDLSMGRWPQILPTGHASATLSTLRSAIHAAGKIKDPVQLVFLTWNPEVSVEDGSDAAVLTADHQLVVDAGLVRLRIIQFHGNRLDVLKGIVWERNYDVFDYRPEGPPSLSIFDE